MVHHTLQKEHTRGTNDIESGILAFAMQQHDTKSGVLVEQLRSASSSTLIDPDRGDAVRLEGMVDYCDRQPKAKTEQNEEPTAKRVCPGTKHNTLGPRFVFLKVQQMSDQRLNLCPITSKAFHFADRFQEVRVDIVVLNDATRLRSRFIRS